MKKKKNVSVMQQSKSTSDIAKEIMDRKHQFLCFPIGLGNRSLSHDSIFLSETHRLDPEPPWGLCQENVHGKIQALQIKLQRQKMHLGPPPLVLPLNIKQSEDNQHPVKSSSQEDFTDPLNPTLTPVYSSALGVDLTTLPQLMPCLDNSAARHRMSIKPRNKRASAKSRRMPTSHESRPHSDSMIILEPSLTEHKLGDGIAVTKEVSCIRCYTSQINIPGKGLTAPQKNSSSSLEPKLLVGADDDPHPPALGQCQELERPAVSNTADEGNKQMGIVVKCTSSSELNSHKVGVDHKESLCSSKPKDVEGSAVSVVSSVYTPCPVLFGTKLSQVKSDKELNMMTTHMKRGASNEHRSQNVMQENYLQGQPLKPHSLHRNALPFNNKPESFYKEEGCLQESTTKQQSLRFSVSSDKSQQRQRTRSFTGHMQQAEEQQDPVDLLIKPPNLKTHNLHRNAQIMSTGKDPSQTKSFSTPAVSTKHGALTHGVVTQIGVKGADDANKKQKINTVSMERQRETSASEVKLHTTSPPEANGNQHDTVNRSTPWLPELRMPITVDQNDINVGSVRETIFISPPLYNNDYFIPAESRVFSSTEPQSTKRDKGGAKCIRFHDLQPSTYLTSSAVDITSTTAHVTGKDHLQTNAKVSREDSTELSWMTMAREKTRNLQKLFTSTMNDLAGLQTVTQPASDALTQLSLQYSAGPISPTPQIPSAHPSASPLETELPTVDTSMKEAQLSQPPLLKSSISLTQQTTDQSGVNRSSKPAPSPTRQVQPTLVSARSGQMFIHSTTKPIKSTEMISAQIIHATQQELSELSLHQPHPFQQTLSQSVTKPQASQSLHVSSPKLTPHQPHQSPSPVSRHRPLVENTSFWPVEKVDWISMPQEISHTESQAQYAGGLESKALLINQWCYQKPDTVKVDQKSPSNSRTYQFLDEFPTISSHSRFTELAVSPRPIKLDREVKWQKKTFPPPSHPSSSHLSSNSDRRQPSWMELAKRKSTAWSDKTMD